MASKTELKRFRSNLADELDSAALYETLATVEQDGSRKAIYAELAASERKHAQVEPIHFLVTQAFVDVPPGRNFPGCCGS